MSPMKKARSLGLTPLSGGLDWPGNGASGFRSRALTKTEQGISTEARKQALVIDVQIQKTNYAQRKLGEMHRCGSEEFLRTEQLYSAVRAVAAGRDFETQVEELTHAGAQLAARQTLVIMEIGGSLVADEVGRSLYQEDEPEEERGLLRRLFGG